MPHCGHLRDITVSCRSFEINGVMKCIVVLISWLSDNHLRSESWLMPLCLANKCENVCTVQVLFLDNDNCKLQIISLFSVFYFLFSNLKMKITKLKLNFNILLSILKNRTTKLKLNFNIFLQYWKWKIQNWKRISTFVFCNTETETSKYELQHWSFKSRAIYTIFM